MEFWALRSLLGHHRFVNFLGNYFCALLKKIKIKNEEEGEKGFVCAERVCVCLIMWLACGMASLLRTNVAAFSGSPEAQVSFSLSFLFFCLSTPHQRQRAAGSLPHYCVSTPEAGLNVLPQLLHSCFCLWCSFLQRTKWPLQPWGLQIFIYLKSKLSNVWDNCTQKGNDFHFKSCKISFICSCGGLNDAIRMITFVDVTICSPAESPLLGRHVALRLLYWFL